jgi:membrane associated rhomboid family serine protease
MFSLRDENPRLGLPGITSALTAKNAISWILLEGVGHPQVSMASPCHFDLVPGALPGYILADTLNRLGRDPACRIDAPVWPNLFMSMIMHGGWFHIDVEEAMGALRFVIFDLGLDRIPRMAARMDHTAG